MRQQSTYFKNMHKQKSCLHCPWTITLFFFCFSFIFCNFVKKAFFLFCFFQILLAKAHLICAHFFCSPLCALATLDLPQTYTNEEPLCIVGPTVMTSSCVLLIFQYSFWPIHFVHAFEA